jgi:carboxyl-terminal processing protease
MNKKILILAVMLTVLCLLSSCAMIPASKLQALFSANGSTTISSGGNAVQPQSNTGDSVVISREEYEKYRKFSELVSILDDANQNFYQENDPDKMIEYATRGLMSGLEDPYSFYYNPDEYAELWEEDEGNYVGIGVMIQSNMETQICTIIRVFEGGPAQEAGVQRGDILYKVNDDIFVDANNLQEAVNIMRGEPNTDVNVTFLRNGEEITFTITRRSVNVNQVACAMLDDKIGYIALYEFAGKAEIEFERALNELVGMGAKGIILDLRDNSGGWVEQARYIADLFMDEGEVCYLQFRNGEQHTAEYRTTDGKTDVKLAILINENSASSSEILTGALRDCAGAVTVGVKSFGKGIIQEVVPVGEKGAGYQMTIAQYFTPKGSAVHGIGITPDYIVPLPEGDNGMYQFADADHDIQLQKALEVLKEALR